MSVCGPGFELKTEGTEKFCAPIQPTNNQQTGGGFGNSYFGGLLSGILGNLSLGFGQGAGQSLNPQQPQVIQQPPRDNTIIIVIIAVVVVGIVVLMNRKK